MTMADNIKFSRHKEIRENGYIKYDNYDAIEVPFTDAIPSDYIADMGVPISFNNQQYSRKNISTHSNPPQKIEGL